MKDEEERREVTAKIADSAVSRTAHRSREHCQPLPIKRRAFAARQSSQKKSATQPLRLLEARRSKPRSLAAARALWAGCTSGKRRSQWWNLWRHDGAVGVGVTLVAHAWHLRRRAAMLAPTTTIPPLVMVAAGIIAATIEMTLHAQRNERVAARLPRILESGPTEAAMLPGASLDRGDGKAVNLGNKVRLVQGVFVSPRKKPSSKRTA